MLKLRIMALTLTLMLILCTTALALSPSGTTYPGMDVSRYQGDIDFAKVKADGVEYVYIRAGEGDDYTDPYLERNYENAKAQGLHIGFYYYVTATTEADGRTQGKRFASLVEGKDYDCRLAMDFEDLSGLTSSEANAIGKAFLEALTEASGQEAVIYSDWSNAQNTFGKALSDYPLWIAEYGVDAPRDLDAWSVWVGWQHTSTGSVSGISGHVDLDYFTEDILLPGGTPTPTAPPKPTPPTPKPTSKPTPTAKPTASPTLAPTATATPTPSPTPKPTVWPTPTATPVPETFTIAIVKGDFLYAISQRYGATVSELKSLNGIKNPNLIYAGANLLIPKVPDPNEGHATYAVKAGDTLTAIAGANNMSVAELAALNGISNPNRIFAGQVLRLD